MFVGSDSMKATVLQAGLKCFVTVCKKCLASLEMWLDVESRSVVRVRVFNFNGATAGDIEVYSVYNVQLFFQKSLIFGLILVKIATF